MRSVGVDTNVQSTKRLTELNQRANNELKEVKGKTAFNGHGFSEKEASKTNEHANGRRLELLQAQCGPLRQNQQPIGPVVQWERFLPVRSLKVLLVENDDSTRQLVSALLRNCSYEVTAVANGLEAWKILADLTKHIDLVLTEVVMPYLSGVGLLSKIMNNISCKNIPVIMMSSDDSMGIVFNCLSKGAVDFLVKPIRKNELKNLWQHVWRKCHSVNNYSYSNLSIGLQLQSSGSGSESGIWTQKYMKSRSIEGSDNEVGSDDEGDSGSISLTAKDGSDNGSDTQSSWPKRAAEVNSSKAISHWHQLPDPPNSTCGQVLHTRLEAISDYQEPTPASRECVKEDDKLDTLAMGKDLAIGVSRDTDLQFVGPSKNETGNMNKERLSEPSSKRVSNGIRKGTLELICETAGGELRTEAADLVGNITKTANTRIESAVVVVPNEDSNIANIEEKDNGYAKELPVLELSLKRVRDAEDTETHDQQRNVLRQSNFSAFSRYHTATKSNPAPTGNVGSCSPLDNSSEAVKGESTQYLNANSNENRNQQSNGSSNNNDMGSTTNNAFSKPEKLPDDNQIPKSIVSIHPSFALQGAHEDHTSSLQPVIPDTADVEMVDSVSAQPKSTAAHQQVQVRHHHHYHHHHHHHHVHNMQQQKQMSKQNGDESLRNTASNVINGSTEGNAANYGSASGSNNNRSSGENGSSGKQGSPSDAVVEGAKIGSDTGVTGKCETGDVTGSRSGSGVDQSRLTLREAALQKFRQKRKQRCFEKKVRYQSRKKLAEQRPRVRGQFVRQGVQENKNEEANS